MHHHHILLLFLLLVSFCSANDTIGTVVSKAGKAAPAAAKAPAAPPAPPNVTEIMTKGGCKSFANLLLSTPDASSTFQSAVDGGLTAFCPTDSAVASFLPSFKNLSSDAKLSMLLYHAVPVFFSLQALKSNNGVMNTLATDGTAKNFNFTVQNEGDAVDVKTAAGTLARVTGTVFEKDPVGIYTVDHVLEPLELFKPVEAPAPAPEPAADAPKAGKKKKTAKHASPPAPGPSGDGETPADQKVERKKNAGTVSVGVPAVRWLVTLVVAVVALGV